MKTANMGGIKEDWQPGQQIGADWCNRIARVLNRLTFFGANLTRNSNDRWIVALPSGAGASGYSGSFAVTLENADENLIGISAGFAQTVVGRSTYAGTTSYEVTSLPDKECYVWVKVSQDPTDPTITIEHGETMPAPASGHIYRILAKLTIANNEITGVTQRWFGGDIYVDLAGP